MIEMCNSVAFTVKTINEKQYLAIVASADFPFESQFWMVEGLVGTVRADKSGSVREKVVSGKGFWFDGFVYFPPEKWGDEKVQELLARSPKFFDDYAYADLWVIGTNYGEDEDRFLIFPQTCLCAILGVFDFYDLNGRIPLEGEMLNS